MLNFTDDWQCSSLPARKALECTRSLFLVNKGHIIYKCKTRSHPILYEGLLAINNLEIESQRQGQYKAKLNKKTHEIHADTSKNAITLLSDSR